MQDTAHEVAQNLFGEIGDALLVVGYFSPDDSGVVYQRRGIEISNPVDSVLDELLDDALLESIAHPMYEQVRDQRLVATTRTYDRVIDTVLTVDESTGILFGLERDGSKYEVALEIAEETVRNVGIPMAELADD